MENQSNVDSVAELVRSKEQSYISDVTLLSKYVSVSQYEVLNTIDAYLNSKHISGSTDSMGREKPFFNICVSAANVWYRATDIDRKNIRIKAPNSKQEIGALLATIHLQNWMKREKFGQFLNEWGRVLSRYGSAVVKFVASEGTLKWTVVPWNRIICDPINFEANPVIEKFSYTPAELKQMKNYDQEVVDDLIRTAAQARRNLGRQQIDSAPTSEYIDVYEVHGNLPKEFITENESDEFEYSQQMHVVSFVSTGKMKGGKAEYKDFTLVSGYEKKTPYILTHLIKEEGKTLATGPVQQLFESQWMVNYSAKAAKDQLDIASKLVFQTADSTFVGQNILSNIENGDILVHAVNSPLTQANSQSHDITSLQNFAQQWQTLGNQLNGVSDAMLGVQPPSGSAWRQTEALLQESHSLFELMTENKGLYLEEMLREHIIPYLKTKMDTSDEVAATLEANDIYKLDAAYISNKAIETGNKKIKKELLGGDISSGFDYEAEKARLKTQLEAQGQTRYIKPSDVSDKKWKDIFKDLEWEVEIDITQEQKAVQDAMTTLNTLFTTIADPVKSQVLKTPEGKFVFNKILSATGEVSPIELAALASAPQPVQPQPQLQGASVGAPLQMNQMNQPIQPNA